MAYLYNDSPIKDTVVVNDRMGDRCRHGDFLTCDDRFNPGKVITKKWENCMTIDRTSWGYNRNSNIQDHLSTKELIVSLVSTVALGGNLLLNVGPTADGVIPAIFQERLIAIGEWLETNGEAIFSSRPWRVQQEGDVWYTTNKDNSAVYVLFVTWPSTGSLTLASPQASDQSVSGEFLGYGAIPYVGWTKEGLSVRLPRFNPSTFKSMDAWVVRLRGVR
mmetsp:Transcript_57067/g.134323  ORF Transcript_57067/g.134323 Transcript_57067/m.134323 type:complete len:219 (-) Transcript_57067:100-756(-)